jgi:hypothetical protein
MSCYAGFLLSLTLYLQDGLRFSPLHAGLIFAVYASGFATVSLTWTRAGSVTRERLPVLGPLVMGAAILAIGLIASSGGFPLALAAPLLFAGGAGHACGFSPLANRLTTLVRPAQAGELSGLILTADFVGMMLGAASFVGLYLSAAPQGADHALAITAGAIAAALIVTAACARRAHAPTRSSASVGQPAAVPDEPGDQRRREQGEPAEQQAARVRAALVLARGKRAGGARGRPRVPRLDG